MSSMSEYISRTSDPEKKKLLQDQWAEACDFSTIHCPCGQKRHLIVAIRCLYCGMWFCVPCAEKHFEMTIQEWIEKKRIERRKELEAEPKFTVRDRSGRHSDMPATTEKDAYSLVQHFTQHDPDSRCYVVQNSTKP